MTKPIILDLFCGAGGASMGYHQTGFDVVGVDIEPQPRYPFEFWQMDALEFCEKYGNQYDAIHASPPCQGYSVARKACKRYPDLIPDTRIQLENTGVPFIIENVPFAPLRPDVKLYGCMFNLPVIRQRWFELGGGFWILNPIPPQIKGTVSDGDLVTVAGGGHSLNRRRRNGRTVYENPFKEWKGNVRDTWAYAMGIDWMNKKELTQAIPPAYTRLIGEQLITYLKDNATGNKIYRPQ